MGFKYGNWKCPKCSRKRKHLAYGQKKGYHYCCVCDCSMVNKVNKKAERRKAKKEINLQISICS